MKCFKIVLPLLIVSLSSAQEPFAELSIKKSKYGGRVIENVFTVVNDEDKTFAIFTDDNKGFQSSLMNFEGGEITTFSSERPPKRYDEIIGYNVEGNDVTLFLKNRKNNKFGSIHFDFDYQTAREELYDFKLKDEIYLKGYNHGSLFYLITLTKKSNDLNFYVYQGQNQIQKTTVEVFDEKFKSKSGKILNLHEVLSQQPNSDFIRTSSFLNLIQIDDSAPNSIENVSAKAKIYSKENGFVLSIENRSFTHLFNFLLPELTYTTSTYGKPEINSEFSNSNSFVFENNIYLINASAEEMKFSVLDVETKEIIKETHLKKDEEIPFKNTPIIQEGGGLNKYREMEKSTKLLRRLAKEDIGIAVNKIDEDHIITIGSKKMISTGGAPMMMPGFGAIPMGAVGGLTVAFNPTFFAYNSYTRTKSTRIKCLFDKDFNHLEGIVPDNTFDRIKKAADAIRSKKAETIFKLEDSFIWGYFNKTSKVYSFYRF